MLSVLKLILPDYSNTNTLAYCYAGCRKCYQRQIGESCANFVYRLLITHEPISLTRITRYFCKISIH